jgi:hypothetical protein
VPHPASGTDRTLRRGAWNEVARNDLFARARSGVSAGWSAENRGGGLVFVLASMLLIGAIAVVGAQVWTSEPTVMGSDSSAGGYPRHSRPPAPMAPGAGRTADTTELVDTRAGRGASPRTAAQSRPVTRPSGRAAPASNRSRPKDRHRHAEGLVGRLGSLPAGAVSSVSSAASSSVDEAEGSLGDALSSGDSALSSDDRLSTGERAGALGRNLGRLSRQLDGDLLSGW